MGKKKSFNWGMASFIVIVLCAIPVGYDVISSCENNYSQVEYASETNEKFYQKMVKMDEGEPKFFDGLPTCLTSVLHIQPGDEILTAGTDTLYLVWRDLNRRDINRYPFYVMKDNNNKMWTLFRHNDKYRLTRVSPDWLKTEPESN